MGAGVALRKESVDRNSGMHYTRVVPGVALRKESVDRNTIRFIILPPLLNVALRKESVDRNGLCPAIMMYAGVALRKESVDRNICQLFQLAAYQVALRKESVDRNATLICSSSTGTRSLSARRAWIEMPFCRRIL